MDSLKILDVVVLLTDLPADKLKKGSLGTIVDDFKNGSFLVEFANVNGVSYAISMLTAGQLLKVHQEPIEA